MAKKLEPGDPGYDWSASGAGTERDQILDDAKQGLSQADKFFAPIEAAGNIGGQNAMAPYEQPNDVAVNTFMDRLGRGVRAIATPQGALEGLKQAAMVPVKGYGELAHLADAVVHDPGMLTDFTLPLRAGIENIKNVGAAEQALANEDPEVGGRAVRDALLATAAPEAAEAAIARGPAFVGGAIEGLGKGSTALANSTPMKAAGKYGPFGVFMGHPGVTAAGVLGPPALRGLGNVLTKTGRAIRGIDLQGML